MAKTSLRDQVLAARRQPRLDGGDGGLAERHHTVLGPLAPDQHAAAGQLEGVELRGLHDRLDDVEFLVPKWNDVPDLDSMPKLRVVQVTFKDGSTWTNPRVSSP